MRTLTQSQLIPNWPFLGEFKKKDARFKNQKKKKCDEQRHVQEYPSPTPGTQVFIKTDKSVTPGIIHSPSYHKWLILLLAVSGESTIT